MVEYYKGICFSIPREELIIHNETNDSDKISQLFPFEKTHSNSPEIKALQAPSVHFSRKRSVYLKKKGQKKISES